MGLKKREKQLIKTEWKEQLRLRKGNKLMSDYNLWLKQGDFLKKTIRQYTKISELGKHERDHWETLATHLSQSAKRGQRLKRSFKEQSFIKQELLANPMKQPVAVQKKKNWIETFVFYSMIVFILIVMSTLLTDSTESGTPRNIGGYAPLTVLTKSMNSVYPKDSFLLIKVTDPNTLKIGEDITYIKENNSTVTHRIVGIEENYQNTGQRGFETKGVDNPAPDEEIVIADNVIGKVIYSSFSIGKVILFVRNNLLVTAILLVVSIFFIDALVTLIKTFRQPN